jgi:hypothetical protein
MAQPPNEGTKPPYIAYRTLLDLVDKMARDGFPPQIDKSYLDNYSGGYGSQVIAALESLGLLEENGKLSERLKELAQGDEAARKHIMKEILTERYPTVVELGRINATQGQHEDAFRELGVRGDTLRKAIAFYRNAAEFAGIPLSKNFRVPRVQPSGKPRVKKQEGEDLPPPPLPPPPAHQSELPGALVGLLDKLPREGEGWIKDDKDRFMNAFTAFIDLFYPIVEPEYEGGEE